MKAKYTWTTIAMVAILTAAGILLLTLTDAREAAMALLGLVPLVLAGAKMPVVGEPNIGMEAQPGVPVAELDNVPRSDR